MAIKWDESGFMREMNDKARDFLMAAAAKVEAEAKRRCPVDTGRLKNSIHAVPPGSADFGAKPDPGKAYVGTNVEYALYQEMGFTHRSGKVVPGKWYLRGALESLRSAGWKVEYG